MRSVFVISAVVLIAFAVIVSAICISVSDSDGRSGCIDIECSEGGTYDKEIQGHSVTVTAVPYQGYTFAEWQEEGKHLSYDTQLKFGDKEVHHLRLVFQPDQCSITVNDPVGGRITVSGTGLYGSEYTVEVSVSEGYVFEGWYIDGNLVSEEERYSFTVTGDADLVAKVIVAHDGGFTIDAEDYGFAMWLHVVPDQSVNVSSRSLEVYYGGEKWFFTYDDLSTIILSPGDYVLRLETVFSDGFVAVTEQTYHLANNYTVVIQNEDHGTFSGEGYYWEGETVTLTILTLDKGYTFAGWYCGDELLSADQTYSFVITGDMDISVRYGYTYDVSFTYSCSRGSAPMCMTVMLDDPLPEVQYILCIYDSFNHRTVYEGTIYGSQSVEITTYGLDVITVTARFPDGVEVTEKSGSIFVDGTLERTFKWQFQSGSGWWREVSTCFGALNNRTGHITAKIPFSDYLIAEQYSGSRWWSNVSEFVQHQDGFVNEIAYAIRDIMKGQSDLDLVNSVLKFVQSIKYEYDIDQYGTVEYFAYPVETLWSQRGDCEDHAILFAYLARALGFDVVLYEITTSDGEGHVAAGVSVPGASGSYTVYGDRSYYFCEATVEVGDQWQNEWDVGDTDSGYTINSTLRVNDPARRYSEASCLHPVSACLRGLSEERTVQAVPNDEKI